MKELKDYLHLYLGCEAEIEGLESIGRLIYMPWFLNNKYKGEYCCISYGSYETIIPTKIIKPFLRKISDLKKNEAIEVCRLRWDSTFMQVHRDMGDGISTGFKFTYQPYDASMYEDAQECCYLDFNCRTNQKEERFRMTIYPDFSVYIGWLKSDGNHNVTPLARTAETVLYFLSKHFDLFGLIPSGIAISLTDKK